MCAPCLSWWAMRRGPRHKGEAKWKGGCVYEGELSVLVPWEPACHWEN